LLHPAAGDPNRSWPLAHWTVLAQALLAAGHQVIRVGHGSADPHRSLLDLTVPGLLDGANRLDPLAFAALCQRADLLVSTDSGPVQLAGATEIALVGIYTVAPGRYRLPFRHGEPAWRTQAVEPSCPCFPCYQLMHDPEIMAPFEAAIREGILTTPELFSEWCVMEEPFRCLEAEILPERVLEACLGMLG
jgi:ADP-heptose:LPS heptosyltransferase